MGLLPPFSTHALRFQIQSCSPFLPMAVRRKSRNQASTTRHTSDIGAGSHPIPLDADNGRLPAGPDCGSRGHTPNNLSRACTCRLTNKDAVNRSHQLTSTGAETSAHAILGRCSPANYALLTYIYRSLRFQNTRIASTTFSDSSIHPPRAQPRFLTWSSIVYMVDIVLAGKQTCVGSW